MWWRLRILLVFGVLRWVRRLLVEHADASRWVDDEVTFVADGLTIYGTYRHRADSPPAPAALLISESGNTDRNGDNAVAGTIGTMRPWPSCCPTAVWPACVTTRSAPARPASVRIQNRPADVGSAVYTAGAKAAVRFLAGQPGTDKNRISVYGHGEGAIHALMLATDTSRGAPKIHSLGLLQPLAGRYLDLITDRVRADMDAQVKPGSITAQQADEIVAAWTAAVAQARTEGTVPAQLPDGLSAILNPGNVKAVVETDAIDPLALAEAVPAGTPVLLTCSDSDGQANCDAVQPLADALKHTALDFVHSRASTTCSRTTPPTASPTTPSDQPLSPQLVTRSTTSSNTSRTSWPRMTIVEHEPKRTA